MRLLPRTNNSIVKERAPSSSRTRGSALGFELHLTLASNFFIFSQLPPKSNPTLKLIT
jgi:hypothetical protein